MDINKYKEMRKEFKAQFDETYIENGDTEEHISPSGNHKIVINYYDKPESWSYSKATVIDLKSNKIITEVKRNYGIFWHSWVSHANNNEYLLCGEDYQGYTTINLTKEKTYTYFPEDGYEGSGFCWAAAYPSPDSSLLAVDGCYWACPYDLVLFNFTEPDILPYKELKRIHSIEECSGWSKDSFTLIRALEVRKSDKKPYSELTDKEQDILDADTSLIENIKEKITIDTINIKQRNFSITRGKVKVTH